MEKTIYKVGIRKTFDLAGGTNCEEDCAGYFFNREDAWKELMEQFEVRYIDANVENIDARDKYTFWKHIDERLGVAIYEGYDVYGEKWTKSAWLEEIRVR